MTPDQVHEALLGLGIHPAGRNGDWVQAPCPFAPYKHERGTDRSASFGVKAGARCFYNCFACKSKGRLIDLPAALAAHDGRDYAEQAHALLVAEATGAVVQADTYEAFEEIEPLPEGVYGDLFLPLGAEARAYAEGRGVAPETLAAIGVRDWPEEGRIMFPVRGFDGHLYGWTGRSYRPDVKAKVWNLKGMDKGAHLLGAELATCQRPLVLVEGLIFYARLHDMNVQEELGVDPLAIMGSDLSFEQANLLAQVAQPVILFLDGDKAGRLGTFGDAAKGKDGAAQMLARALPVKVVSYPVPDNHRGRGEPNVDPDDLTDEQVYSMIETARTYVRRRRRQA